MILLWVMLILVMMPLILRLVESTTSASRVMYTEGKKNCLQARKNKVLLVPAE